jgi:protein SDA1
LLRTLFPLLPQTTSSSLRSYIRKTILSDIRTANLKGQNHKLNRFVQAILFGMVESGKDMEAVGDKGKTRATNGLASRGDEAAWAIILTNELWKKGIWYVSLYSGTLDLLIVGARKDARTVSIVAQGCFHPIARVQNASLHFFLGSNEDRAHDSDDDDDDDNSVGIAFTRYSRY